MSTPRKRNWDLERDKIYIIPFYVAVHSLVFGFNHCFLYCFDLCIKEVSIQDYIIIYWTAHKWKSTCNTHKAECILELPNRGNVGFPSNDLISIEGRFMSKCNTIWSDLL